MVGRRLDGCDYYPPPPYLSVCPSTTIIIIWCTECTSTSPQMYLANIKSIRDRYNKKLISNQLPRRKRRTKQIAQFLWIDISIGICVQPQRKKRSRGGIFTRRERLRDQIVSSELPQRRRRRSAHFQAHFLLVMEKLWSFHSSIDLLLACTLNKTVSVCDHRIQLKPAIQLVASEVQFCCPFTHSDFSGSGLLECLALTRELIAYIN